MLAMIVAIDDLLMSMAASVVAGIAVTVVVSVAIRGAARYVDYQEEGRTVPALASLLLAVLGLVLTVAIVVTGIALMVAG